MQVEPGSAENRTASDGSEIGSRLQAALEENERLRLRLGAVRHSLGNHLALMSAILARQARACDNEAAQNVLEAAQARMVAVSAALRACIIDPDLNEIDVGEPFAQLAHEFRAHASALGVEVSAQGESLALSTDDAASLLLIMNELASNALEHAFPDGRTGRVALLLRRERTQLTLEVQDDGVGRGSSAPSRLGDKIVAGAVRSLGATIAEAPYRDHPTRPGRRVVVTKPLV